jgi:hypothetical protein
MYEHDSDGTTDLDEWSRDRAPMVHARRDLEAPSVAEQLAAIHQPRPEPEAEPADEWYASAADERDALLYDRDEDAMREQQYEREAGID